MPVPCSGIRGGPRKIARPAKCGGPGANNRVSGVWLYIGLCCGFILLYAPAFLSLLGKLWRRPRGLLVICSGRLRRPRQGLGSIKPRINYCIKRHAPSINIWLWQKEFCGPQNPHFLVAVVIVGFVRAVCFDASDSSKTIKVVWALCHIIPFFMPLPYTASLYHVYAGHLMPYKVFLLNASGGYFMLSYAASSLCDDSSTLYFMLPYANNFFWYHFSITYSS